jgi:DNA polymerase-3 subunit delta'
VAKRTRKRTIEAPPPPDLPVPTPVRLDDVIGQDRALEILRAAVRSERVHHAWVFQGPPGVGKFTAALAFGAVLLDPTSAPNMLGVIEPDPDSPTRRLLRTGTHPDLHVVTKELARFSDVARIRDAKLMNIPMDVLRTRVLEPASLAPSIRAAARATKVFIVDEAELIDPNGQNALLKTLEEPAEGTVLILVTSQPERLLPTIRSRCQRVAFTPLTDDQMRAWLDRASGDEASPLAALGTEERRSLLALACGSPGTALLAVTTGMARWPGVLEPRLADLDAGRPIPDLGAAMADLVGQWATAWVEQHEGASKDAANKAGAAHMLRLLASRYARALGGDSPARAARAIDAIGEAEANARSSVQLAFVFEDLAARLSMVESA